MVGDKYTMLMNLIARIMFAYINLLDYILALADKSVALTLDYLLELFRELSKSIHAQSHTRPIESGSQ